MRLHRIELLTEFSSDELPFHHQTTVIAGLGRLEREALAQEIAAALGSGRPGLSADLSTHSGRRLEIQRPLAGPSRVVDIDLAADVTAEFEFGGNVHALHALNINPSLRVTNADLAAAEETTDRVHRLARLDQNMLWGLAISLAELEVEIARHSDEESANDSIDADVADRIEQLRADVDVAQQRLEDKSNETIVGAAALTIVSFVVAYITHPFIAAPLLVAAIAMAYRSWTWHQEHQAALESEQDLLDEFGLESYLDFQLRKVDALTNDTAHRRKVLTLAERRRAALEQWHEVAGSDVSLDWAATHRPTIAAAAAKDKKATSVFAADSAAASEAVSLALAERIREATASSEPSPLMVDDIFADQSDATIERLLWLIDHHSQQLQFIVMTSDQRVLEWAGARSMSHQARTIRLAEDPNAQPIDLETAEVHPNVEVVLDI